MILTLLNQTAVQKTYLSGLVILPASGSVSVTGIDQFNIVTDGGLTSDIATNSVHISDGTNEYSCSDAFRYLLISLQNMRVISGGTDGIMIGNIGDRIKVDATFSTATTYSYTSAGKMFKATSGMVLISSAGTVPLFLMINPAGSGKNVKLNKINIFNNGVGTTPFYTHMTLNPTVTSNGTVVTPTGGLQAGQIASITQCYHSPTATPGTNIDTLMSFNNSYESYENFALWLEPGNSWMMDVTNAKAQSAGVTFEFAEE